MNIKLALSTLNVATGSVTIKEIKTAYHKACAKFHPDRNPAGLETMKVINKAYNFLKDADLSTITEDSFSMQDYGDAINNALNAIINIDGIKIEICGSWVWVSGNTKEIKDILKTSGYKWACKKIMWYFRPEEQRSFNRTSWSIDQIRAAHGQKIVETKACGKLQYNN